MGYNFGVYDLLNSDGSLRSELWIENVVAVPVLRSERTPLKNLLREYDIHLRRSEIKRGLGSHFSCNFTIMVIIGNNRREDDPYAHCAYISLPASDNKELLLFDFSRLHLIHQSESILELLNYFVVYSAF